MKLRTQQKQWDRFATDDPFWAILTDANKKNRGWSRDEFFATGRSEIGDAVHYMETLGHPKERRRALDFGCGAGRATQALADHFEQVTGVDVSPAMLEVARKHNGAPERCSYVLNSVDDLNQFADETFDLVYSRIVLQHVPPRCARRYVREFLRVLRPGGLALFQLPSRLRERWPGYALVYRAVLWVRRRILREPDLMEMYGVPREVLIEDVQAAGARVLAVTPDESAGREWEGYLYAVTR